jgi:hypothetical protein
MKEKQLQLVTFEQAKRLKKAGFNWSTAEFYRPDGTADIYVHWNYNDRGYFSAPSVALALKWFRDEKAYRVSVMDTREGKFGYRIFIKYHTEYDIEYQYSITNYDTFDAVESALLDELLRLVESIKNNNDGLAVSVYDLENK